MKKEKFLRSALLILVAVVNLFIICWLLSVNKIYFLPNVMGIFSACFIISLGVMLRKDGNNCRDIGQIVCAYAALSALLILLFLLVGFYLTPGDSHYLMFSPWILYILGELIFAILLWMLLEKEKTSSVWVSIAVLSTLQGIWLIELFPSMHWVVSILFGVMGAKVVLSLWRVRRKFLR